MLIKNDKFQGILSTEDHWLIWIVMAVNFSNFPKDTGMLMYHNNMASYENNIFIVFQMIFMACYRYSQKPSCS